MSLNICISELFIQPFKGKKNIYFFVNFGTNTTFVFLLIVLFKQSFYSTFEVDITQHTISIGKIM